MPLDEENKTQIVQVDPSKEFSYTVYGWDITKPPPTPKGPGLFPESPTTPVHIANSSCQALPTCKSTTALYNFTNWGLLHLSGVLNGDHWVLLPNQQMQFVLTLAAPVNIDLVVMLAATPSPGDKIYTGGYQITANEKIILDSFDHDAGYHSINVTIPAADLKAGKNLINLNCTNKGYGLWVQSVQASSAEVPLEVSYFWQQVGHQKILPGGTLAISSSVTTGITSTNTQTNAFAGTIGVAIDVGGFEGMLAGITAKLSASFTASSSQTHAVAISKQLTKTETQTVHLGTKDGYLSITWVLWQLCLQYKANGVLITAPPSGNDKFLFTTQFMETK